LSTERVTVFLRMKRRRLPAILSAAFLAANVVVFSSPAHASPGVSPDDGDITAIIKGDVGIPTFVGAAPGTTNCAGSWSTEDSPASPFVQPTASYWTGAFTNATIAGVFTDNDVATTGEAATAAYAGLVTVAPVGYCVHSYLNTGQPSDAAVGWGELRPGVLFSGCNAVPLCIHGTLQSGSFINVGGSYAAIDALYCIDTTPDNLPHCTPDTEADAVGQIAPVVSATAEDVVESIINNNLCGDPAPPNINPVVCGTWLTIDAILDGSEGGGGAPFGTDTVIGVIEPAAESCLVPTNCPGEIPPSPNR
jgi:hypothetical protein